MQAEGRGEEDEQWWAGGNSWAKAQKPGCPGCVLGGMAGAWVMGGRAGAGKVGKDQITAELASHTKKLKPHLRTNWESLKGVKQESDWDFPRVEGGSSVESGLEQSEDHMWDVLQVI